MSAIRFRRLLPFLAGAVLSAGLALVLAPLGAAPAPPLRGTREIVNSIGMKLVRIPAAKFRMGSPLTEKGRDNSDEGPQHEVEITQSFYMGVYEVTQEEHQKVMGNNPSSFAPSGAAAARVVGLDTKRFPVEMVSWLGANDFCARLSSLPRELAARRFYRLPTEAEWEHACRAGAPESVPFGLGTSLSSLQANFNGNQPYGLVVRGPFLNQPEPVGSYKKANAWGLFDMHGNVSEWCADWYDPKYYHLAPKLDPQGPDHGTNRVQRGGNYKTSGSACRSAYRLGGPVTARFDHLGFRVVCEVDAR